MSTLATTPPLCSVSTFLVPRYERIGGEMGVEALVENAYEKALNEDRVRFYFEKVRLSQSGDSAGRG